MALNRRPSRLPRLLLAVALLTTSASFLVAQGPGGPPPPPPPPTAGMHATIVPDGSSASYAVTEQLVGINFPNDAIGMTSAITGNLVINANGSIPAGSSKIVSDLRALKSDQDQRDGFIRQRVLETDKYPVAEFVLTKIEGLPRMIPFTGQAGIEITGNLTIHGVTKEVTFQGITTFNRDGTVAGRAKTSFEFSTFGLTKPSIARLMSVSDKIALELTFRFKRS